VIRAGLPPEVYAIWEAYPWRFGQPYCLLKTFMTEMTSSASILTIVAFTVERYVAICHPLQAHSYSRPSRAIKTVLCVWATAVASALPYPVHTRIFPYLIHPWTGEPLAESVICNLTAESRAIMRFVFEASTFILFVVPIGIITILYILIGFRLRVTTGGSRHLGLGGQLGQSRRNVIRMLGAQ
jgi:neuromedin U receptor 1